MTQAIQVDDLRFTHPGAKEEALEHISFSIPEGQSVALLGPSGAGKSTLLSLLDGRLRRWKGKATVLGAPLHPDQPPKHSKRADTGFVFQEFALVERSTVLRNVLNGRLGRMSDLRGLIGHSTERDLRIANAALKECGIYDVAQRRVDSLSGGQRQRVAIARCLAQEPKLVLADEPVSNLDPSRANEILALLTGLARARGAATIFSSHQPELARRFADRVIGLRNGRIIFDLPSQELAYDETERLYEDNYPNAKSMFQVVS